MAALKNRDFTINGVEFHLNNNPWHNEFEGKYMLLYWNSGYEKWMQICTVNSIKEAKKYAKMWLNYDI